MTKANRLLFTLLAAVLSASVLSSGCTRSPTYYIARGNEFFDNQKYDDAWLQYKKAIQADPNSSEAYYREALVEMREGAYASAYPLLQRAADLSPQKTQAAVILGDLVWSMYKIDNRSSEKLYSELSRLSSKLLGQNSKDFDGLRFKADIALADKRVGDAIDLLEQANAIQASYPDVVMPLANLLVPQGKAEYAENLLRRMVARRPSYVAGYEALYKLYLSEKRTGDGEAVLRQRVRANPQDPAALVRLAEHYSDQGNAPAVNATLNELLDKRSQLPTARIAAGEFYALHHNSDEALRQFDLAIRENAHNEIAARKKIVTVLLNSDRNTEADKQLDRILALNPKDTEALTLRAMMRLSTGRPADVKAALGIFKELVKVKPNDEQVRSQFIRALIADGNLLVARAELSALIQREPGVISPRLLLAELSLRQGRYAEAAELTHAVLDLDPQQEQAQLLEARALAGLKQYQQARTALTRLLRENRANFEAEMELGLLDVLEKRYDEANAIFRKHYRPGENDVRPVQGLVQNDLAQGQVNEALALLTSEIQRSPNSPALRATMALVATHARKYDLAVAQYAALAALSDSSELQLEWADVLHRAGNLKGALEHCQKAQAMNPRDAAAAALEGRELAFLERFAEAMEAYRQALKIDPGNAFALNNLAYLLADEGKNLNEALQMAQSAHRIAGDNLAIQDTLGWVYLKKGLTQSAVQVFQTLVQKEPANATYQYHFGAALFVRGEMRRAKEQLLSALEKSPSKSDTKKISALLAKIG